MIFNIFWIIFDLRPLQLKNKIFRRFNFFPQYCLLKYEILRGFHSEYFLKILAGFDKFWQSYWRFCVFQLMEEAVITNDYGFLNHFATSLLENLFIKKNYFSIISCFLIFNSDLVTNIGIKSYDIVLFKKKKIFDLQWPWKFKMAAQSQKNGC